MICPGGLLLLGLLLLLIAAARLGPPSPAPPGLVAVYKRCQAGASLHSTFGLETTAFDQDGRACRVVSWRCHSARRRRASRVAATLPWMATTSGTSLGAKSPAADCRLRRLRRRRNGGAWVPCTQAVACRHVPASSGFKTSASSLPRGLRDTCAQTVFWRCGACVWLLHATLLRGHLGWYRRRHWLSGSD